VPVRVGVVGAGPWASLVHVPVLAHSPDTELVGLWARRADAATELATKHGVPAYDDVDALIDACDAVAFAVPPDVQATLATRAATAGKHLLLEKPIALGVPEAEALCDAIDAAGVRSMVVLSNRYADAVRSFLASVSSFGAIGGRGIFVSGALLGGMFATPWRLAKGPLLDLGPHMVDLLDAALGRVVAVRASGNLLTWVDLQLEHDSGVTSSVALCASSAVQPGRCAVELYSRAGVLELDLNGATGPAAFATLASELAHMVTSGEPHGLDARHGLHLQRIICDAEAQLLRR
jgi:predicted dehydrogenase